MIYPESKKLHLIASLINERNEEVLKKVEKILSESESTYPGKFFNFSNTLTEKEISEFEKNIEDGCERINENPR